MIIKLAEILSRPVRKTHGGKTLAVRVCWVDGFLLLKLESVTGLTTVRIPYIYCERNTGRERFALSIKYFTTVKPFTTMQLPIYQKHGS